MEEDISEKTPDSPKGTLADVVSEPQPDEYPAEVALSLTGHLEELRTRIFWSVGAWAIASCLCYVGVPKLLSVVSDNFLEGKVDLIFTRPTEAFIAYLKVAMVAGLFVASPVLLYHIVMFVAPGLRPVEKRWMLRLIPVSVLLFLSGATFAFFVVLPVTMNFFLSFSTTELRAMLQIGDFLGFVTGILALCGASFQLPLILFFASVAGIVNSRQLREGRRFAIFGSALIAAVATPTPDAFTMSVVALPIWILFEISVIFIRLTGR